MSVENVSSPVSGAFIRNCNHSNALYSKTFTMNINLYEEAKPCFNIGCKIGQARRLWKLYKLDIVWIAAFKQL